MRMLLKIDQMAMNTDTPADENREILRQQSH